MGRKAVIVECISNGRFLVDDILSMGLEPVIAFPPFKDGDGGPIGRMRAAVEGEMAGIAEILRPRDFEDLCGMLSGYDIACILVGSEYGVAYTDMLCRRLGFPGNDPDTVGDRTDKFLMHRALERAGLRCIRGADVTCEQDIRDFWHGRTAVIKPRVSSATVGVHVCETLDQCIEAWRKDVETSGWSGERMGDILIQDYARGREYIVNTLSRDGVHRVTDMWCYWKEFVGEGVVYDCCVSVYDPGEREEGVAAYALACLDALGLRNGPSHMEIKCDEEGPVLIEINARPMGGHFSTEELDWTVGHHITDLYLRSATDPGFVLTMPEGIPPARALAIKLLILYEGRTVDTAPIRALMRGVRSFRRFNCDIPAGVPTPVPMTVDLLTSPGDVILMHEDPAVVMCDFATISAMERDMPDLLYGRGTESPGSGDAVPDGSILIDDEGYHPARGPAEGVTVRMSPERLDVFYDLLFRAVSELPRGGWVRIEGSVFKGFPYGARGVMSVLTLADLEFDAVDVDGITAYKNRDD